MIIRKFVIAVIMTFKGAGATKASKALDKLTKQAEEASLAVDRMDKSVDGLNTSLETTKTRASKAASASKRLGKNLQKASDQTVMADRATKRLDRSLGNLNTELDKTKASARKTGQATKRMADKTDESGRSLKDFGGHARAAVGILTGFAAAAALVIVPIIRVGGEFESLQKRLDNLLGSKAAGAEAFAGIREFAANTPFQLAEVTNAFVKLQGRGIQPTRDRLTSLGDLAASSGKSFDDVVEAALDATQGEGERLKELGIRMKAVGDNVELSFRGQTVSVKKNQQAILDQLVAFGKVEGIAGSMAVQMDTVGGVISNLKDKFDGFLALIGDLGVLEAAKELFKSFGGVLGDDIAGVIADVVIGILETLRNVIEGVQDSGNGLSGIFGSIVQVGKLLINIVKAILVAFFPFLLFWRQILPVLQLGFELLGLVAKVINDLVEALVNLVQRGLSAVTKPLTDFINSLTELVGLTGPLAKGFDAIMDRLPDVSSLFDRVKASIFSTSDAVAHLNSNLGATGSGIEDFSKTTTSQLTDIRRQGGERAKQAESELRSRIATNSRNEKQTDAARERSKKADEKKAASASKRAGQLAQFEGTEIKERSASTLQALQRDAGIPAQLKKRARTELRRRAQKKKKKGKKKKDEPDEENILDILGLKGPGSTMKGRPAPQTLIINIAPIFNFNLTMALEGLGDAALSEAVGAGGRAAVERGAQGPFKMFAEMFEAMTRLQADRLIAAAGGGRNTEGPPG